MREQYIIDNLDEALKLKRIKVYYQPIVRNANGRVCVEESFARWEDAEGNLLEAQDFISALEKTGNTYKLDLYVVDRVLEKMKEQADSGLYVVPQSVNLSWADFYTGDIIEEIIKRVDEASIPRDKLVIEIAESVIGKEFERMIKAITRLKESGFTVWLDNYGSGGSSPMILQRIPVDLIKIDKTVIQRIEDGPKAKIILTELIRLALALGMDTIAEGVEKKVQVDFLKDIGCTMLQGNFFCKPIPLAKIIERNIKGIQIGFENPSESEYYDKLGKVNFYEISAQRTADASLNNFFDTWPMVLVECNEDKVKIVRSNNNYKDFANRNLSDSFMKIEYKISDYRGKPGRYTLAAVMRCAEDGKSVVFDERTQRGMNLQLLVWRVAVNPVTQVAAVMVVILSVMDSSEDSLSLTYNYIARALSEDYIYLYFVDMDTGDYVEYHADGLNRNLTAEKAGIKFFETAKVTAKKTLYKADQEDFFKVFNKANIEKSLQDNGSFTFTYRIIEGGEPTYVSMKIIKVRNGRNNIIIGVNNVDAQMRQKEALERVREESRAFYRIAALAGDFLAIYAVDPMTDAFIQYSTTDAFNSIGALSEGEDFYKESCKNAQLVVYGPDRKYFFEHFKKDLILNEIEKNGIFTLQYRLLVQRRPVHVRLKATKIQEKEEDRIILGIINIEDEVMRQREYEQTLSEVTTEATIDELTGVKRKLPYLELEAELNRQIALDKTLEFAIIVCDINGLKEVNDTLGHQAGDQYIIDGCKMICNTFKQSPVFRLGGDEFAVVARDQDYDRVEELIGEIAKLNAIHKITGEVIVAAGMAKYENDSTVAEVFHRADKKMYENKKALKAEGENKGQRV
ncbi:MAG: GGDEF domain-containing protein [Lachnospiraceae bacterium]|nr:GGDEF domain-containing protein [Lachnospiraceae bacterium]